MSNGYIQTTAIFFKHLASVETSRLKQMVQFVVEMAPWLANEKTPEYVRILFNVFQAETKTDMRMTLISCLANHQTSEEVSQTLTAIQNILETLEEWHESGKLNLLIDLNESGDFTLLNELLEWHVQTIEWKEYWKVRAKEIWENIASGETKTNPAIMIQTSILIEDFEQQKISNRTFSRELLSLWNTCLEVNSPKGRPTNLEHFFYHYYVLYPLIIFFDPQPCDKMLKAALIVELSKYRTIVEKRINFGKSVDAARSAVERVWEKGFNEDLPVVHRKWWQPVKTVLDNWHSKSSDFDQACFNDFVVGELNANSVMENIDKLANRGNDSAQGLLGK